MTAAAITTVATLCAALAAVLAWNAGEMAAAWLQLGELRLVARVIAVAAALRLVEFAYHRIAYIARPTPPHAARSQQ